MSDELSALIKRPDVQKRALIVALIVGTVLNCINQVPDVMHGDGIKWFRAILTYCVPYLVALYSAVAALRQR